MKKKHRFFVVRLLFSSSLGLLGGGGGGSGSGIGGLLVPREMSRGGGAGGGGRGGGAGGGGGRGGGAGGGGSSSSGSSSASSGSSLLFQAIRASIQANFGDVGAGCALATLSVRDFDAKTSTAVVKCAAKQHAEVRACLTFINNLCAQPVIMQTLAVCGSARTCEVQRKRIARQILKKLKRA
ncbi:ribonuclease P/MRP protein subunit POP5 [Pseudoscourfieldia marina]